MTQENRDSEVKPATPLPWTVHDTQYGMLIVKEFDRSGKFAFVPGPSLMADYRGGHVAEFGYNANQEAQKTAKQNLTYAVLAANAYPVLKERVETLEKVLEGSIAALDYCRERLIQVKDEIPAQNEIAEADSALSSARNLLKGGK